MELISMTDFVLQFEKPVGYYEDQSDFLHCQVEYMGKVMNYALFLKQPLKLEMFVTCDDEGNVLEEPKEKNYNLGDIHAGYFTEDMEKYNNSKEKVLFEGWEKRIKNIELFKDNFDYYKVIENVIHWDLTLTQNAIKQIMQP